MAGFALSGLLHEMAISVPVRAGFGLPLLYFLMHGALVLAPLPIHFHRPFLAGLIWPLIGIPPNR